MWFKFLILWLFKESWEPDLYSNLLVCWDLSIVGLYLQSKWNVAYRLHKITVDTCIFFFVFTLLILVFIYSKLPFCFKHLAVRVIADYFSVQLTNQLYPKYKCCQNEYEIGSHILWSAAIIVDDNFFKKT